MKPRRRLEPGPDDAGRMEASDPATVDVRTLTDILETITDGRAAFDAAWRFTFVNDRAERHYGRPRADLIGRVVWDVFPEARGTVFDREYHRAVAEHTPGRFEAYSVIAKQWLEVFCFPLAGGLSVSFRDISDRRRSQEALDAVNRDLRLRVSEFETLLDVLPVAIAVSLDRESRVIRMNRACARMLRLDPHANASLTAAADVRPRHFRVMHAGRELAGHELPVQVAAREGRDVRELDVDIVFEDGTSKSVLEYAAPLFDDEGQPRGSVGVFVDLTDRLTAEHRFRLMADNAPVMVWVTEPDGSRSFLSQSWYEFTGQTPPEGLGYGWLDVVHPDDRPDASRAFRRAVDHRAAYRQESRFRRHDGEYRWVIEAATPYLDPAGVYRGHIGSVIDISERKVVEDERERMLDSERIAHAEADRANQLKDEFLASLSHELRTPLNAILGWAQLLRSRPPSAAFLEQGLETLERNAKLQAQLIDDLLDMSRILSGRVRLDVQHVNIDQAVEAAVEAIRPAAEAKQIHVQVALDRQAGSVSGDPTRLQQVFWNVLSNAVKFTPRGGRVEIALKRVDSHVEVVISDTGIGIAPDFLPSVFERFRQADASTTRRHGGLGLGLSIARQLVELHGGSIRAESAGPGHGAAFSVELPLAAVTCGDRDGWRARPQPAAGVADLSFRVSLAGVSVLVVDDDLDARRLIALILEACGARVEAVPSARAALEALARQRPDVIVSDIGLPEQDGYALMQAVRALGDECRDIPALALTAFARSEDRRRALMAGFQLHVAKPVEPAELCTAVASLAGRLGP